MTFKPDSPSIMDVIRLPKVTPKNAAQAQWSNTLPLDFAETVPTAIYLTENEAPKMDEPPNKACLDGSEVSDDPDTIPDAPLDELFGPS